MIGLLRKNSNGFSLIELISVIAVVALLTAVAASGIGIFFTKFKELTLYADLQQDLLDLMMQMKNGVPIGTGNNALLMGVASATTLSFPAGASTNGSSSTLLCDTSVSGIVGHEYDFITFMWDQYNGTVNMRYKYGQDSPSNPVRLFPVNHPKEVRVTDMKFKFLPHTNLSVVQVSIEAEVKCSRTVTRRVRYTTYMRTSWL
jgi:prepilin-type N-terminal cleavage/methylation domain-containing protein